MGVHDEAVVIRKIIAAGAVGYVLQSQVVTVLIPVIEQALVDNRYILPDVSGYDLPPNHR